MMEKPNTGSGMGTRLRAVSSAVPPDSVSCQHSSIPKFHYSFLVHLLLLLGSFVHGASKPNVLFIAVDDMNDWTTLFDEKNPIQTPNLQRLAARGVFFENAYCAAPACSPSRAAIMTGRAPHKSGVVKNEHAWARMLPDAEVIPRAFMASGYDTRMCGKIFHHGPTGNDPKGKPSFQLKGEWNRDIGKPATNHNGYPKGHALGGVAFDFGMHEEKQGDEFTVEWAAAQIKKTWKADMKPQFLALGIFRPHLPFWAPSRLFANYPLNEKLFTPIHPKPPMPNFPKDDMEDVPDAGYQLTLKESFFQESFKKAESYSAGSPEQYARCYQAASTYADEMLGRILDKLDATGQAENTIIVLWSDHGYHLGDKGCYVKFTLWEKANHVPLIIVAPGITKPRTRCAAPVSLLDIYPTLLDLAGLPANPKNDGVSLKPLLEDPHAKWDRPALMTYAEGNHAIKTAGYRYIRYQNGSEELYTHADHWNLANLVKDPAMQAVLESHRQLMKDALAR